MTTLDSIPESLRLDKDVTPFISRSIELLQVDPVVSYYCKFFVLDHILTLKLHVGNPAVKEFTSSLLDETEAIRNSESDSNLKAVLSNRQFSFNAVFLFAFKMYNSCLEDLNKYDGAMARVGLKLKATLNFWSLLLLFYNEKVDSVDYAKTTGGQCITADQFAAFCKEKQKMLKFQLGRLMKDEIPVKSGDTKDNELERELEYMSFKLGEAALKVSKDVEKDMLEKDDDEIGMRNRLDVYAKVDSDRPASQDHDNVSFPGVLSFDPSGEPEDIDDRFRLPGAPKFSPDDDLSHINKSSSVLVFTPGKLEYRPAQSNVTPKQPAIMPEAHPPKHNTVHINKENVSSILDFNDQVSKIQKHAKFAISALNYEDLDTAEEELLQGLELIRAARNVQLS
ncbi:DUF605-domain-containing protein [Metschnikowia bicuspidata]|uniref:DUF605-domain-containing protein n=1 Tax=Metschnikowia bicuspidata TaxID=27322 RepID=A0A4P9ZIH6_9ASCO|nr:DUF605-domain-containing protein [Metschnikowia bicuspidata]